MNLPFSVRVLISDATTFAPTLRTAPSPKRMSVPTEAKFCADSLTSGGSTVIPSRRQSARYTAALSLSSPTEVSRPAMYSAGKLAFRYAVQYDTRPYPAACDLLNA